MSRPDNRYVPAAGRWAPRAIYDPVVALTMRERTFRRAVTAQAVAGSPSVILDVGCGTGTMLVGLAELTGAELIGIDGDPAILARAAAKAHRARAGIEFREGLAQALPCADASVDVAIAALLLHHLDPGPKARALTEMLRVLRPGGRLIVADWGRPRDPLTRLGFLALQALDGFGPTRDHAAGRLPGIIEEAGFDEVTVLDRWRTPWGSLELLTAARR